MCVALFLVILSSHVIAADNTDTNDPSISNLDTAIFAEPFAGEAPLILFNDQVVSDSMSTLYDGSVYVSLQNIVRVILPDAVINFDGAKALVSAEGLEMSAVSGKYYVTANDRCFYVPSGIFTDGENLMLPVDVLVQTLGSESFTNRESGHVYITPSSGAITHADEFYNETDLYYLSHLIYCESGNQTLEGKIAVGNVVLNRTISPAFPNSICDVIFQRNQFYSDDDPLLHRTPNSESVVAAKLCLEGAQVLPTALWFNRTITNSWASKNRVYITTIGAHDFYA